MDAEKNVYEEVTHSNLVKKIKKLRRDEIQNHPLSPGAEFSGGKWKSI